MLFDFEKMEVYQLSLKLIDIVVRIIKRFPKGHGKLADQMRRAAESNSLLISEGVGEYRPTEKARFYRMSLRSVSETCSAIQIAYRLQIANEVDYTEGYDSCTLLTKMLTNLVKSMEDRAQQGRGQGRGLGL